MTSSRKPAVASTTPEASPVAATATPPEPAADIPPAAGSTLHPDTETAPAPAHSGNGHDPAQDAVIDVHRETWHPPNETRQEYQRRKSREFRARQRAKGIPPKPRNLNPDPDTPNDERDPRDGGPMRRVVRPVDYHAMALMCVDITTGTAAQLISPEWKPSDDEHATLTNATETYLRAKQFPDVPPGWVLCFVVFAYSVKRLQMPDTQSRIARAKSKIREAFRFGKPPPAPQVH